MRLRMWVNSLIVCAWYWACAVHAQDDDENVLRNSDVIQDANHIKEHLKESANVDFDNMSPEEKEFYYFKMHDYNDDNLMDGLELFSSLIHKYSHHVSEQNPPGMSDLQQMMTRWKKRAMLMVDRILHEDDKDRDGYLNYFEYTDPRRSIRTMTPMERVALEKETLQRMREQTDLV